MLRRPASWGLGRGGVTTLLVAGLGPSVLRLTPVLRRPATSTVGVAVVVVVACEEEDAIEDVLPADVRGDEAAKLGLVGETGGELVPAEAVESSDTLAAMERMVGPRMAPLPLSYSERKPASAGLGRGGVTMDGVGLAPSLSNLTPVLRRPVSAAEGTGGVTTAVAGLEPSVS